MSWLTLVLFVAGFALLVGGAELLVRGASGLAIALGISPLVVGTAPGVTYLASDVPAILDRASAFYAVNDDEIVHEALLLLDGGAETTRTVIGTTCLELARHPDQRAALVADPGILGRTGVEELIRWVTPILNMRRTATEDHELHGEAIAAGDEILKLFDADFATLAAARIRPARAAPAPRWREAAPAPAIPPGRSR